MLKQEGTTKQTNKQTNERKQNERYIFRKGHSFFIKICFVFSISCFTLHFH